MTTYTASIYSNKMHNWYELSGRFEDCESAVQYFYTVMKDDDIILKIVDERGYLV